MYSITCKGFSIALIGFFVLVAYWIIEQDLSFFKFNLNTSSRMMTFLVFQGLLITALTLSLNLNRTVPNKN